MVDAIVEIKNLNKSFGGTRALSDINLSIKPGEFVSIIGPSGCGKSTLLRIVGGLDPDYSGRALFNGEEIKKPSRERGFIFQDCRLLPWLNVYENIKFSLPKNTPNIRDLIYEKLEIVGLSGAAKKYPKELSGGMAQRTAIARALANSPKILLLDEPFGALDAITKIKMQEEISRIWRREKTAMILVTHDIDEAVYLGGRVVVMTEGGVKETREIDLPLPRDRVSAAFASQKAIIYKVFFGELETPFSYAI